VSHERPLLLLAPGARKPSYATGRETSVMLVLLLQCIGSE